MYYKDVGILAVVVCIVSTMSHAATECASCIPIYQIQGNATKSSFEGQRVTTQGVVTFWSSDHKYVWIQDPVGDGDTTTSDAIMVVSRNTAMRLAVGDEVRITATVQEYAPSNGWPVTRLTPDGDIIVLANASKLPAPVDIAKVPSSDVTTAIEFWRTLEGMRVHVGDATVVGPTDAAGGFVVLPLISAADDAMPRHALVATRGGDDVDYHVERIFISAKPLQITPLKVGDLLGSIDGIVDFRHGHYEILAEDVKLAQLPRLQPLRERNAAGNFSIVSFNAENFFDLEDDPAKSDESSTPTPAQFEVKLKKLVAMISEVLKSPAILVLQEVENQAVLQQLADRINAVSGNRYVATSFDSSDARGIEVAMLWDAAQVELERAQSVTSAFFSEFTGVAAVEQGREPLLCLFRSGEFRFAVVGVHLKSKLGDEALFGTRQPPLRMTEDLRKRQATMVRTLVEQGTRAYPDLAWIVAGDFNDFSFPEPGEGADHPLGIVRAERSEFPLQEATDWVPARLRYTYIYEGNAQQLDHMLISDTLKPKVAAVNIIHANADFPVSWAQESAFPWRVSDHDIIELRLQGVGREAPDGNTRKGALGALEWVLLSGMAYWRVKRRRPQGRGVITKSL